MKLHFSSRIILPISKVKAKEKKRNSTEKFLRNQFLVFFRVRSAEMQVSLGGKGGLLQSSRGFFS